jgi:hypothetical protein
MPEEISRFGFVATLPRSTSMKRLVLALILGLAVCTVVGCGGGSSSGTKAPTTKSSS